MLLVSSCTLLLQKKRTIDEMTDKHKDKQKQNTTRPVEWSNTHPCRQGRRQHPCRQGRRQHP